jgi:hypothetical protein
MKSIAITLLCLLTLYTETAEGQAPLKVGVDHPRILLLAGGEESIREKLNTDVTYTFLHKTIIKECDELIEEPTSQRVFSGRRLLRVSRECRRRIFFLSYAWRVTGEEKYLKRAEKEMVAAANFQDWNPSHFLDVAEMTMGLAIGYDWLYKALSPATRSLIENAIIKKGLEESFKEENNTWLTATHNWNQVCNAGMVYGALAVMEKKPELANKIINRAIKSVKLSMDEYLPDGVYPEGYGYWSYGTTFNVLLISALDKAFGSDFGLGDHPGFLKTPQYLLHMTGTSGLPFNYSDCDPKPLLNPAMVWFAARLKDPSLLAFESRLIEGKKNLHRIRELPALMIWGTDINFMNIPDPQQLLWSGNGKNPVALMRSDWDPRKGIYVGLKAGSATVTHSHMDAGSFVMDALGERWALDLGNQDYNSLESKGVKLWSMKQQSDRWKVFRLSNHSHNTLTFNKGLQNVGGKAEFTSVTDNERFRGAVTDLSSIYDEYVDKSQRGVAIVDNQYVVIRDEVHLSVPSTIRWNMVTPADVVIIDNKTAELRQNGKKVILRVTSPADAVLATWPTTPPQPYDEPNPGTVFVGFETKKQAGESVTLNVLLVPETATLENKMAIPPLAEWPRINP